MSRPLKVYKIGYRPPESSLLLVILTLFKQSNVNFLSSTGIQITFFQS